MNSIAKDYIEWGEPAPAIFIGEYSPESETLTGLMLGNDIYRSLRTAFPTPAMGITEKVRWNAQVEAARVTIVGSTVRENLEAILTTHVVVDKQIVEIHSVEHRAIPEMERELITVLVRCAGWPTAMFTDFVMNTKWDWLAHNDRRYSEGGCQ